ncbi:MAG TPA: hypothetical protein VGG08_02950, partial [Solirubrobacteraceae bacterium]
MKTIVVSGVLVLALLLGGCGESSSSGSGATTTSGSNVSSAAGAASGTSSAASTGSTGSTASGGGAGAGAGQSTPTFIAQADTVCKRENTRVVLAMLPTNVGAKRSIAAGISAATKAAQPELAALRPPSALAAAWSKVLADR